MSKIKNLWSNFDFNNLKLAIKNSKKSSALKLFPGGAVVARKNNILSSAISSSYPTANKHADSESVDKAIDKEKKQLTEYTLYCSVEPCIMCLSRAFWTGIRRVVFAASRKSTKNDYYEGNHNNKKVLSEFNEKMEYIHLSKLEKEALNIIHEWEKRGGFNQ